MKKQIIRLTEQDLQTIIENVVKKAKGLNESSMDEGMWDVAKSFGKQYANRANNAVGKAANKVKGAYQNVKQDVKNTMQNARLDGATADMQKAFGAFRKAVQNYIANGGQADVVNNMISQVNMNNAQ